MKEIEDNLESDQDQVGSAQNLELDQAQVGAPQNPPPQPVKRKNLVRYSRHSVNGPWATRNTQLPDFY